MATIVFSNASVGAPTLTGQNGTLCNVLDWALQLNGWAIEYTATNQRIYRAAVGHRRRLWVAHDSAVSGNTRLATVRGVEDASSASEAGLVDPFPTAAQSTNAFSTVLTSTTTDATSRAYRGIVTPTFVLLAISCSGASTGSWELFFFGDVAGADAGDAWSTVILVAATSTATATSGRSMASVLGLYPVSAAKLFWCRSIDGLSKSSRGCLGGRGTAAATSSFSSVTATPVMRGGYGSRIMREKVGAHCLGSATTSASTVALVNRGWIPNLWNPVHSGIGAVTADDTIEDTGYHPSALFQIVPASTSIASLVEFSDTWSVPGA